MNGAAAARQGKGSFGVAAVVYAVRHGFAFAGSAALHTVILATFLFVTFLDDYLDPPLASDALDAGEGAEDWATAVPDPLDPEEGPFNVYIETEPIPVPGVPAEVPKVEAIKKVPTTTPAESPGSGSGATGTGTGSVGEPVETEEGKGSMSGGVKVKGEKRPCPEPIPEIVPTASGWMVSRALIDYYAGHPGEMDKLGRVFAVEDGLGGFRVGLTRCSILKQAGVKHGDIVRTINGRRVDTLPGAIATYFALRNVNKMTIHIVRKGAEMDLVYRVK